MRISDWSSDVCSSDLATGAIYGPAGAVIADVSPPEKRAATFGLLGAAFGIGFIIGPGLGGLVATLGPRAPFIAAAILAGLNALAMLFLLPETLDAAPRDRTSDVEGKSVSGRVDSCGRRTLKKKNNTHNVYT